MIWRVGLSGLGEDNDWHLVIRVQGGNERGALLGECRFQKQSRKFIPRKETSQRP